jgi:hypothetical protein
MRIVTLTGTMRQYSLFQTPSTDVLEMLVKKGLQENGWGFKSVSIGRNSYLNNTLEVTIEIVAVGNDVSRRIKDGITKFLTNFLVSGDDIFRDVSLRISHDTGAELPASKPAAQTPPIKIKKLPPTTIDRGHLATVTVRADSTDNQPEKPSGGDFLDGLAQSLNVSRGTLIAGSALLLVVVLRRF